MPPYSIDELMCVCIAKQVRPGQLWAQGISTPLVMAGLILAKLTHAPDVRFMSAIGQGITQEWAPLRLCRVEDSWLTQSLLHVGFISGALDVLPSVAPLEFFRPAQVDARGNTNNVAFGRDPQRPRMRLPGSGGIPDVSVQYDHMHLYVPRHSRVVFREPIDFVSGLGHVPQRVRGAGPRYLISDLGQFDWHEGRMRLISVHPGWTAEAVQGKTGFELTIAPDLQQTPAPTAEHLRLLREVIDPLHVRKLETLSGATRKALLREIIEQEQAL